MRRCLLLSILISSSPAFADDIPPPLSLPEMLTLDDALKIFRQRGIDLLIAEAAVTSAEGDVKISGAIPNPNWSAGWLHSFVQTNCATCFSGSDGFSIGVGDSNAIEDSLSGKRYLRLKVARAALQAARMSRADAQRALELQVKQQYILAVQARDALDFALEVQQASDQIFDLNKKRYDAGAISEPEEAKIEAAKLEADQAVDAATQALRAAKVGVAFLLGVRGPIPDFRVEQDLPKFVVPPSLASASPAQLIDLAHDHRPDLKFIAAQRDRAEASIRLAKRSRFPDLSLNLGYTQEGGTSGSAVQPPTISIGLAGTIPLFYFQAGEIKKAEADYRTQSLQQSKIEAQLASEVETAWANFSSTRRLVERMESRLLERVKFVRDKVQLQYQKGGASLLEYLDAQRQYISTNVEYIQDLTNYWTAVYQLEAAVGMDLR